MPRPELRRVEREVRKFGGSRARKVLGRKKIWKQFDLWVMWLPNSALCTNNISSPLTKPFSIFVKGVSRELGEARLCPTSDRVHLKRLRWEDGTAQRQPPLVGRGNVITWILTEGVQKISMRKESLSFQSLLCHPLANKNNFLGFTLRTQLQEDTEESGLKYNSKGEWRMSLLKAAC